MGTRFLNTPGSDPRHYVWNLGFPLAWFIYDDHTPPHWFTTVTVVTYGLFCVQGVILLACAVMPWLCRKK